jgi:hypothetical protein
LPPPTSPVTLPAIETTSFAPSPPNSISVGMRPRASMIAAASERAPALSVSERCSSRRTPLLFASSRRSVSTAPAFSCSPTFPVFPPAAHVSSRAAFTISATDCTNPLERPLVISAAEARNQATTASTAAPCSGSAAGA